MKKNIFIVFLCLLLCVAIGCGAYFVYSGAVPVARLYATEEAHSLNVYPGNINGSVSFDRVEAGYETTTASENTHAGEHNVNITSTKPYVININRKQNVVIIYKNDGCGRFTEPVKAMVCSVGACGETPTGTFKTSDKYKWRFLFGDVYGQYATRITGHILFHSVPYFEKSKDTLEYEEYNKLGTAASAGCVRLCVADAKWIYDNCPSGTIVVIYDSDEPEPLDKPVPVNIDISDNRRGWDPTDPDPNNPWK